MRARPAATFAHSLPEAWACMPDVGDERAVAEQLCDPERICAELAARLQQVRPELHVDEFARTAVWVPNRDSSDIGGTLQVGLMGPDAGDEGKESSREYFRSLIEPDQRTWCTVFSRSIDEVDIPAGPALLVREVITRHEPPESEREEIVTDSTIYIVFPPDSTDMLELTFKTPALELGDDMAAEAAWIVQTLEVTLGEPA